MSLATHCGTHIDAPAHFFKEGMTVENIPLSQLHGPALVLDLTGRASRERIEWSDIACHEEALRNAAIMGGIVLLRTGWSEYWGTEKYFDHPFLDESVAKKFVEIGIKTIGIDAFSPDETVHTTAYPEFPVHSIVLGAGMVIGENLANLEDIQDGSWVVCLAPLRLDKGDGSPVRAYAVRIG